jgi:predicted glycoside hydrolase/deacetylase ChbG (UPF0249 family)
MTRFVTGTILALASTVLLTAGAPAQGPIRLIVKGDDMGAAHGINVATIEAFTKGVLTTTNVIVPGPWFPEAVRLLNEHPDLDVGVHLALTSEWDNVKWRPLTPVPSLVDENGYFFPTVTRRPGGAAGRSIEEANPRLDEIERELRAQLEQARRLIPRITYTWEHMGFGRLSPGVREVVRRLSKEYGLIVPSDLDMKSVGRVYDSRDSGDEKARKLAARLETLEPGLWLHIDHASTDTPEMQAIGHEGYEWVAADRSANLAAWTSPMVREVIERRKIQLTSYRDLR